MKKFNRYILASGLSFTLNIGLTAFLHEVLAAPEELAFAIALFVLMIVNFLINRHYTFAGTTRSISTQFIAFTVSTIGFRGSEYLTFLVIHSWLGIDYLVATVSILFVSFIIKFFVLRDIVFS